MVGESIWIRKGDTVRLIERRFFSPYKKDGFEICDPPVAEPVIEEPEPPKTNLVTLYKDGAECHCGDAQIAAFEAAGWSREAATKGVTDGGNELEGRKLDQEHGSGGHVEESVDDAERVEQPASPRRNRPNRRKRGNDEDS